MKTEFCPREERTFFTVTDLKQFAYCPRVVFYTYCLPLLRPETYKMRESQLYHKQEREREERRSLRAYGLPDGERGYDVRLRSDDLALRGRADLVIYRDAEVIPVDYKLTRRKAGPHFRLQLAAYGLMLAEANELPATRGFLYSMATRRAEEVPFSGRLFGKVRRSVQAMRQMVEAEAMPEAARGRARCVACEFRRFCNDL